MNLNVKVCQDDFSIITNPDGTHSFQASPKERARNTRLFYAFIRQGMSSTIRAKKEADKQTISRCEEFLSNFYPNLKKEFEDNGKKVIFDQQYVRF